MHDNRFNGRNSCQRGKTKEGEIKSAQRKEKGEEIANAQ
jgi:hypothetical protein